jgi:hypothetical protein
MLLAMLWDRNGEQAFLGQERAKKMIAICNAAKGADVTPVPSLL